jgi:thioredoxin 1
MLKWGLLFALLALGLQVVRARAELLLSGKPSMFSSVDLKVALAASARASREATSASGPSSVQSTDTPRLVVAEFGASWCEACRRLNERTWIDWRIAEWSRRQAAAVYINTDREPELAREHRVAAIPTIIVFRDGSEIARRVGDAGPEEMLRWLERLGTP